MRVIDKEKESDLLKGKVRGKAGMFKGKFKRRMNDSNLRPGQGPERKKKFPGGFYLFLIAMVAVILAVQKLSQDKGGRVFFSHQAEHLTNLNLLNKEENRKIAQNDNLVTFTGKFREGLAESSRQRYRFLELLNQSHELRERQGTLANSLKSLEADVRQAGALFLELSGLPVPVGGYVVVGRAHDTKERENSIILHTVPSRPITVRTLLGTYGRVVEGQESGEISSFGRNVLQLTEEFRSPVLGIGNEEMKEALIRAEKGVREALDAGLTPAEAIARYKEGLDILHATVRTLAEENDHVRLTGLRSVRNYLVNLGEYEEITQALGVNVTELNKARKNVEGVTWFFNNRELSTKALERIPPEEFGLWFVNAKAEWEAFATNQGTVFKAPDQPRTLVLEKTFKSREPSPNYLSYIFLTVLPVAFVFFLLWFMFSKQMKGMGSGAMSFGKSPARLLNKNLHKVTFEDVAGVEEAKEELREVVDFLRDPGKFTALGARIPKGVLLIGPPGTGKTLIAKAVAGEADRPFFSISGSDFVEMFVGVGASRIRDLFDQAKKSAPCIVFIDEIDAVGRHRGAGVGGGHDEREQTLNQLLVEMDGFDTNEGVILMAATNRPDVLDRALLRPGRFDRQVVLDLPDIKGRLAILKVHAMKIKTDRTVDLMDIARATPGTAGADLMNILNEAALLAARKGRSAVTREDTLEACDKVQYGKERKSLDFDRKEKRHTAYHESGHAIVGLTVEHADPVEKVTIIPRGFSLGATHFVPEKNKLSYWRKELIDRLAVLMGGRIAEDVFIGDFSSGAKMDIVQATRLAKNMVCQWGMNDTLGSVAYDEGEEGSYMMPGISSKSYSDETAKQIDDEVRKLLDQANERAREIILRQKEKVQLMTDSLMEFETLDKEDVHAIMEGTWDAERKKRKIRNISDANKIHDVPPSPEERKPSANKPGSGPDPSPVGG
ncbi:MAG: ATP-dependent zinc metalloprotease FtsH [Simkaniaceae bacterium]|nr:ATP-dependent zinc metalloprotease FtsH [Simkaniaceae bacterium]